MAFQPDLNVIYIRKCVDTLKTFQLLVYFPQVYSLIMGSISGGGPGLSTGLQSDPAATDPNRVTVCCYRRSGTFIVCF